MLHAPGVPLAGTFVVIHAGLEGADSSGGYAKTLRDGYGRAEELEEEPRATVTEAVGYEVVESAGICARIMGG